jgi:hypothetical protein
MGTVLPGGTSKVTFKIRNVPNFISVGNLEIGYDLPCSATYGQQCDNGTNGGYEHLVRLYLLLDNPIDLVALPWLDFAEYSCRWSFGATDKVSTVEKMTLGIYHGGRAPQNRIKYDTGVSLALRARVGPGGFLEPDIGIDIAGWYDYFGEYPGDSVGVSAFHSMMCDDISTLMWTALETQGIASDTMLIAVYIREFGGLSGEPFIKTQPLKKAGPNNTLYKQEEFSYHSPLFVSGSYVGLYFDASSAYAYDSTGNPWLECDYLGWAMPYYFHSGLQVPNGGLAWDEIWVTSMNTYYASDPSVGWEAPAVLAINPTQHVQG